MTAYSRGDIVLVEFEYTNQSGQKLRPALIVSTDPYHYPSVVTGIIRTITRSSIRRQLGVMTEQDLMAFAALLRQSLGL